VEPVRLLSVEVVLEVLVLVLSDWVDVVSVVDVVLDVVSSRDSMLDSSWDRLPLPDELMPPMDMLFSL